MKALILSCNTGGGHNSCGRAIRQAFEAEGHSCEMADSLQFSSQKLSRFLSWGHTTMYRQIPGLFRFGYGFAEDHPKILQEDAPLYKLLTGGTEQLRDYLVSGGYDTVICTHVFSGLLLRRTLDAYPLPVKTAFVATDYTCSPGTDKSNLDVYFMPDASLAEEFMICGIPGGKLVASGIPVDPVFHTRQDKATAKTAVGIDPTHNHILMMCGSMGCGPMKELTMILSQRLDDTNDISIVCGTNEKLRKELAEKYRAFPNIHIHGFVKNMSALMDSADLYLTKPGGLSTSEALAKALPMVLIDAVAGCEAYNLRYFVSMGGAVTAQTPWELSECCMTLLNDPAARQKMRDALSQHKNGSAAQRICRVMTDWSKGATP